MRGYSTAPSKSSITLINPFSIINDDKSSSTQISPPKALLLNAIHDIIKYGINITTLDYSSFVQKLPILWRLGPVDGVNEQHVPTINNRK